MQKRWLGLALCGLLMLPAAIFSEDLIAAFELALQNDPAYKEAAANYLSSQQGVEVAKSAFRPALNLSASRTGLNIIKTQTPFINGIVKTNTRVNTANLSQTVFNWSSLMSVKQSQSIDKQAEALYRAAFQNLIVRCAQAYFAVLQAEDTLRYTIAEKQANERQLSQAKERFSVGLDAITAVNEAQAEYDATVALELSAKNDVDSAKELLRAITGVYFNKLVPVDEKLPLISPEPLNVDYWVNLGIKYNYTLKAARFAAEAAKRNIGVNMGSTFPVLNLVANYNDNQGANFGSGSFDIESRNVGVELNFPIVQGGAGVSRTRQAQYNYEAALAQMDSAMKDVISRSHQLYNSVISGISVVKADRLAVISRKSSLDSTEAAYKVGTRTIVDVLDQQRDLFDSQRQLASDQYTYLSNFLVLKETAGTLNVADLEEVNSWLTGKVIYTTTDRDAKIHAPKKPYPSASNVFIRPFPEKKSPLPASVETTVAEKEPLVLAPVPVAAPVKAETTPIKKFFPAKKAEVAETKPAVKPVAAPKETTVQPASEPAVQQPLPTPPTKSGYIISAGSFKNKDNAVRVSNAVAQLTHQPTVVKEKTINGVVYYQVLVGPIANKNDVEAARLAMEQADYKDFLVLPGGQQD